MDNTDTIAIQAGPANRRPWIINIIVFQSFWFACVLSAANDRAGFAMAACIMGVFLHLLFVSESWSELKLLALVAFIGAIIDSILGFFGVFEYLKSGPIPLPFDWVAPVWLTTLWLLFATLLRHSISWLSDRPVLAAMLGGIGGPLSYFAGYKFGAVGISEPMIQSLLVLVIVWAALTPLLLKLSTRLKFNH